MKKRRQNKRMKRLKLDFTVKSFYTQSMKWIVAAFLLYPALGFAGLSSDKPITVAVIDTGFGFHGIGHGAKLCKYGHKDFTSIQKFDKTLETVTPVPIDNIGHGTNVAGLIEDYANKANSNFCMIIIKYQDVLESGDGSDLLLKAIKYANKLHVDVINISGGGTPYVAKEVEYVKKFLDDGGIMLASAGNDRRQLGGKSGYKFYPAMDDKRVIVVGGKKSTSVDDAYEPGGELEGANWNVVEDMPKMRAKFDKYGFFILYVEQEEKDVIYVDELEIPIPHKSKYYRVLIKQGNEVFLKDDSSNFGKRVNLWEPGVDQTAYGITKSGTSQATAIATGKLVGELSQKLKRLTER
jgi:subtilisin family serine protease